MEIFWGKRVVHQGHLVRCAFRWFLPLQSGGVFPIAIDTRTVPVCKRCALFKNCQSQSMKPRLNKSSPQGWSAARPPHIIALDLRSLIRGILNVLHWHFVNLQQVGWNLNAGLVDPRFRGLGDTWAVGNRHIRLPAHGFLLASSWHSWFISYRFKVI